MRLHYYKSENFGDALSPKLVEKLDGIGVEYADPYVADMVAVGSVLYSGHWLFRDAAHNKTFRGAVSWLRLKMRTKCNPIKVWGSGFLESPNVNVRAAVIRPIEVYALRGRISHEILDKLGLCPMFQGVAYGDPGLLYPMLLDEIPEKVYDIGVIPHFFDKENGEALFNAIKTSGQKALLIDVMHPDPINTLRQIAKCKTVLSSSLHGCIVSDGMGIPNRHMSLSTLNLSKDDYALKFRDYYSALGMEWPKPLVKGDLGGGLGLLPDRIRHEYAVPQEKVEAVKKALLESFPA